MISGLAGDRLHGDGGHRRVLPARAPLRGGRASSSSASGVSAGVICLALAALFPTGAFHGENVARFQPAKMAAMEGLFETQDGAPLAIIGMPDSGQPRADGPDLRAAAAELPGLRRLPRPRHGPERRPAGPAPAASRSSTTPTTSWWAWARSSSRSSAPRRCCCGAAGSSRPRPMLWALMLAMPFPYIANHAGWTVARGGPAALGRLRAAAHRASRAPRTCRRA